MRSLQARLDLIQDHLVIINQSARQRVQVIRLANGYFARHFESSFSVINRAEFFLAQRTLR